MEAVRKVSDDQSNILTKLVTPQVLHPERSEGSHNAQSAPSLRRSFAKLEQDDVCSF